MERDYRELGCSIEQEAFSGAVELGAIQLGTGVDRLRTDSPAINIKSVIYMIPMRMMKVRQREGNGLTDEKEGHSKRHYISTAIAANLLQKSVPLGLPCVGSRQHRA